MKNIFTKEDFLYRFNEANYLLELDRDKTIYGNSLAFDFSFVFSKNSFEFFRKICLSTNDENFNLIVLDPDPIGYFYETFNKFPCVEFSVKDGQDSYFSELSRDPGASPADAISYNTNKVVVFPHSKHWFLIGERDNDSAIFRSKFEIPNEIMNLF